MDHLLNIGISKDNTAYDKETGEVLTVMNEKILSSRFYKFPKQVKRH